MFKGWHILPLWYLAILILYLLVTKESVELMFKSGYGIWLILFVIVSFLLCWPIENYCKHEIRNKEESLRDKIADVILYCLYPFIAFFLYDMFVVDKINNQEVGSQETVITVILQKTPGNKSRADGIHFKINGITRRCGLSRDEWENYEEGDTISVTYSMGCLNRIIFYDVHAVKRDQ